MKKMSIPESEKMSAAEHDSLQKIVQSLSFAGKNMKTLMICACDRKTDITSLTGKLAQIKAAEGSQVLIIRAAESDASDAAQKKGLNHYLAGHCGLEEILYETNTKGVSMIPAGARAANPELLLNNGDLQRLIDAYKDQFDWVLIEAAPLTRLDASAVHFAACSDGVVFAVKDHDTFGYHLQAAKKAVKQTGCPIIGCIVLDAKRPKAYA